MKTIERIQIYFGLSLDGYQAPLPRTACNEFICGPQGLLQVLETRLGLRSAPTSSFKRLIQFRSAVFEAIKKPVFFKKSAEQDSLATARALLKWRDLLIESGWNGQAAKSDPQRLVDIASLESVVRTTVSGGFADRLVAVRDEMKRCSPGEIRLLVLERKEHLPPLWQRICDQLGAVYASILPAENIDQPDQTSDLSNYRDVILGKNPGKVRPAGDGSLLVVTAYSELSLARAVGQIVSVGTRPLTLIAGSRAAILDQALQAEDEPMLGMRLRSSCRPIPQLLLLVLRLCWQPFNPGALLEFLTHPVCPVTTLLRRRLSSALAAAPGIGGGAWNNAVNEARTAAGKIGDAKRAKAALKTVEEDLADWILLERFDAVKGATGAALSEVCMRLSRWASSYSARQENSDIEVEHLLLLASIASDLAQALVAMERISQLELEKLLQELCSAGWEGEASQAQVGHVHWVRDPAAVISPVDQVIWWNFTEPPEPAFTPWTQAERRALEAQGVEWTVPEIEADLKVETWGRPILAARKQLILMVPKQHDGKIVVKHPLYARLLAATTDSPLPTRDIDHEIYQQKTSAPLVFSNLAHRPLPQPRCWWKLADGKQLALRASESYSSLDKFIYAPFAWVLMYAAKLQRGPVTELQLRPSYALKGTLLHRLLDLLLAAPPAEINWVSCLRATWDAWCQRQWPILLEQEGATMLLPGNLTENLALLDLSRRSLWELILQLRAAKVVSAKTNFKPNDAKFFGGQLLGYVDLLLENRDGCSGVVDLKLGGLDRRQEEMTNNRQLQLAVYGYLLCQQNKAWPHAAYYILGRQRLLTQDNTFFPQAAVQRMNITPYGLENCWKDFEKMWRWRRTQLDEGWIAVTTTQQPEIPDPAHPSAIGPCDNWYCVPDDIYCQDFVALTGWRADQ